MQVFCGWESRKWAAEAEIIVGFSASHTLESVKSIKMNGFVLT